MVDTLSNEAGERSELVGSFARGLKVMRVMAEARTGMTQTEVAEAAGLTRASARRFLLTLIELGYAEQVGNRVALTPMVSILGGARFERSVLWEMAIPLLRTLSHALNESVSAAVRDQDEIVYVARAQTTRIFAVTLQVGSRLPALVTSMGRVIFADLSAQCRQDVVARAALPQLTPHTIADRPAMLAELERVREQGYSLVDQELEIGLRSIAVPVRLPGDRAFAGLNVAAQAGRVPAKRMIEEFVPPLQDTAERIAALIRPQD